MCCMRKFAVVQDFDLIVIVVSDCEFVLSSLYVCAVERWQCYYEMPCYAMLCCAMLCYVDHVLRSLVGLCYGLFCHALLCVMGGIGNGRVVECEWDGWGMVGGGKRGMVDGRGGDEGG